LFRVTGVQTCALPISPNKQSQAEGYLPIDKTAALPAFTGVRIKNSGLIKVTKPESLLSDLVRAFCRVRSAVPVTPFAIR
jgi:hypothetical protein